MYLYIHIYTYTYRHTDLQSNAHEDPAGHLNESVTEAEGSAKEEELDALRATLARERAEHQEDRQELLAVLSRQRQLRQSMLRWGAAAAAAKADRVSLRQDEYYGAGTRGVSCVVENVMVASRTRRAGTAPVQGLGFRVRV